MRSQVFDSLQYFCISSAYYTVKRCRIVRLCNKTIVVPNSEGSRTAEMEHTFCCLKSGDSRNALPFRCLDIPTDPTPLPNGHRKNI